MLKIISLLFTLLAMSAGISLQASEINLSAQTRSATRLVIYNTDLALISEHYELDIPMGDSELSFTAISPRIEAASAILYPVPDTLRIVGQRFQEALSSQELLSRSVGQNVSLVRTLSESGEQLSQRARVLAVNKGLILEVDGRFETELAGRHIVYDSLPEGAVQSSLNIRVQNTQAGRSDFTLNYLSTGLTWSADYIARLDEERKRLDLRAMATIQNHSGIDFSGTGVELVAGSVSRAGNNRLRASTAMAAPMVDSEQAINPQSLGELYLYRVPGAVDLLNNSSQQMALFEARDILFRRIYRIRSHSDVYYSPGQAEQKLKVDSFIEFDNEAPSEAGAYGPGVPMPAGQVRMYMGGENGEDTALRFVGEDRIGHTPEHESLLLRTGQAFNLGARRRQISYKQLPVEKPYRFHNEVRVETVISNAGDESAYVELQEQFSGEWTLIDGPAPDTRDARTASWRVLVPAHGKASLKLGIRVRR